MGRSKKRRMARVAAMNSGKENLPKSAEEEKLVESGEVEEPKSTQPATKVSEQSLEEQSPPLEEQVARESQEELPENEYKQEDRDSVSPNGTPVEEFGLNESQQREEIVEVETPQSEEEKQPVVEETVTAITTDTGVTTSATRKSFMHRSISIRRATAFVCLAAVVSFIAGSICRSSTIAVNGDGDTKAQAEKLSGGDYDTVVGAVNKRFGDEAQFYYTGNVNGQYTMAGYAMDDGSTLITTFVAPADYNSEDGSEPVEWDEIPTDYLSADNRYYVASVSQDDSGYSTTWVDAGEEVSKYASYLRDLGIPSLVEQATSIRYAARINLDSDLVGVEIYELGVSGEALTEALSVVQKAQYTYLHTRAIEAGDSEFADQNEAVLKSIQTNNQMSDGTIEIGVKDGNLYYFGVSTGGGGYSYLSQYTFKDLLPYMPETPDVSNAVDIYQDAKQQYDAQMEAYTQYQQSQSTEDEGE